MIHFQKGDLFLANVEAITNPVNTVGVMGKGLALVFKQRFPENYLVYKAACDRNQVATGKMFVTETGLSSPRWIINFPTKQHFKSPSKLEWIAEGLVDLRQFLEDNKVKSVAIPALGAGLGGLDWTTVRAEVIAALGDVVATKIIVFEP
jgi:O-acetyl-ADP-ribose deacetylase (regulator of RNase III)